ncbi:CocE/NonD family hydrolase C-terminal non-catalytic domain-containing protein [Actinomadura sp. 3N407]|uniref:CocE/NonD family hydrolase C-terminal non-catalytic domain-containing protein n=1 Tax=Actinomadura sp. 3N407 TaxID=3457423 RepID=UPI003FCDFA53
MTKLDRPALPAVTVLVRNPYGEPVFRSVPVTPYLRAGMTVVLQHCRIGLVATSQTFKAGHRIRVQVASSDFPRFDRHPAMTRAEQTVFHDAARPSWITLPIMPRMNT